MDCYGISQNPETKDYIIIMKYIHNGSLRKYLNNNYNKLNFRDKIKQLHDIVKGLNLIHKKKLVHKDFHSGNVLNDTVNKKFSGAYRNLNFIRCYITDLGLCRPVNEKSKEKTLEYCLM
jgi:serine/threonine protein kinase